MSVETLPPRPNPYLAQPRQAPASPREAGVEELSTAECWRLVESTALGRLAMVAPDGRPDVFPINFVVHTGNLFIRSAPGTKLWSIAMNPAVAFEVDGMDDRSCWSVVIRADAERMDTDSEIEASGVLDLVSWNPTEKFDFIRLVPIAVTGRRFRRPAARGQDSPTLTRELPADAPRVAASASRRHPLLPTESA